MNPLYKKLFGVPAKENLIDQAIAANQSEGTTDPEQASQNVDFEAEIKRLQENSTAEQNPAGEPDGSSDGGAGDEGTAPPAGEEGDPEAKPKDGEQSADPEQESDPQLDADLEDIEDAQADGVAAAEALTMVAKSLEAITNTHNTGVVTDRHVNLVLEAIAFQRRNLGMPEAVSISREDDAPVSSAGRLRAVAGRIRDFVREMLAKMQEYIVKIKRWLTDFFRGMREAQGKFEKNTEGLLKRIKHVRDNARPAAEIKQAAHDNALTNARMLLTEAGQTPTIKTIEAGVAALSAVTEGVGYFVGESGMEKGAYSLMDSLIRFDHNDPENSILAGGGTALTPEAAFAIRGAVSAFGNNRDVYNHSDRSESERANMVDFSIHSLPGITRYSWRLAEHEPATLDELIHLNHGYGFRIGNDRVTAQVDLLTTTDECVQVMSLVTKLMGMLEHVNRLEKITEKGEALVKKMLGSVREYVDAAKDTMSEETLVKVLTVYSTTQNAFSHLTLTTLSMHARHISEVIQTLQRWVAESLNIIDTGVELKTGK